MNLRGLNNCGHSHGIGMYYEVFFTLLREDGYSKVWVYFAFTNAIFNLTLKSVASPTQTDLFPQPKIKFS